MNPDGDENWLTGWEQQCIGAVEEQPDYEGTLIKETDSAHRSLWATFQDSATAIAQLYRDRFTCEPGALWVPFQTAAGTVTALYKESCESTKRSTEAALQCGYQRRNKELLSWAKRRRHHIRREDLLAYLAGKPPPPKPVNHHRCSGRGTSPAGGEDAELSTFREALAAVPVSRRPRSSDLFTFITGEVNRHSKRERERDREREREREHTPSSPSDVNMDSPTHHKRPRFM